MTEKTDGISFLPTLTGDKRQQQHGYLYWEFHELGGRRAVRQGDWKLVQYNVDKDVAGAFELYDLKKDPSETKDLAGIFPEKVKELKAFMIEAHVPSEVFKFAEDRN